MKILQLRFRKHFNNFLLTTTAFLLALFPPFCIEWWRDYEGVYYLYSDRSNYGIDTSLIIILFALLLSCLTPCFGRWQQGMFLLLMAACALLGMFATGHVLLYDAPISVGAIDALLGTDLHEAMEYLSFQWSYALAFNVLGYCALFLACSIWVRRKIDINQPCWIAQLVIWPVVVLLALACYQYPSLAEKNINDFKSWAKIDQILVLNNQVPSLRIIFNIHEWLVYRQWLTESQNIRASYRFNATSVANQPKTVVIVLGESMRRSNLGLYGYAKKTTPYLDARRRQMLVFNKAIAPANQTVPSITKMLTQATVTEPDLFLVQPSIITVAKEAGYRTYWLSNQGRVGQFDSKISLLAHEADTQVFTNTEFYGSIFDEQLLHPFSIALQDTAPHKLIMVHLQGSHQSYKNRYPASEAVFTAEQYQGGKKRKKQNKVMAQYDNSIHYTDLVIEQLLLQLEKIPNSILLFVSDHGERFYENGVATAGHGYAKPTKTEYDVPYFIWCNGACVPEWQQAASRHHNLPFSTENLFYTIANMLGLQFADYKAEADILSLAFKPVPVNVVSTERKIMIYKTLP